MVHFNIRNLLLLLFTLQINSFSISISNCNNIKIVNNNKQKNIVMKYDMCPSYLEKFTKFLDDSQGELIVKQISGVFPKMDVISHFVLHTNDVLINYILNNNYLDLENKKKLALFLIKMTQIGDSTGSHILQIYHDLVNCLL
tara:strand:- start:547 stop:972 length:426 start_codon:yes stop_codon:yes gene_type:complete